MKYRCVFMFLTSRMFRLILFSPSQQTPKQNNNNYNNNNFKKINLKRSQQSTSIKTTFHLLNSLLPVFAPVLRGLCHPAVHSEALDCRTLPALGPTRGKRVEVRPLLLLLPVTAALVGAAGGADAVGGGPPHFCSN